MKSSSWVGAVTLVLLIVFSRAISAADAPMVIDESLQVSSNERIELEVMRGTVVIRAGTDNTFRVSGTLDELAEGFDLHSDNGFTYFEVEMPRNVNNSGFRRARESDLEIVVPAGSRVSFTGVNAEVEVDGVVGGTQINTVNGDISASNLTERVELRTVNGNITARNIGGRIDLQTVNGEIRDNDSSGRATYDAVNGEIDIDSAAGEVEVTVVNGSVRARLRGTSDLTVNSVNGDIEVVLTDISSPRISGSTVSGEITLSLPADVDARFSLESHVGGNLVNNITDDEVVRSRFGPGRNLDFSTGQGAGHVDLSSVTGRLELRSN
ncbi:DUF4097 family beta strand repeat-containing protein [Pseudohongiella sp.]|uniref:DUF4097 domain-containing protein n=1 Tax=marine sediment metagenome TaxID=412755 RepID=A0A0F9VYA3_9ZZZZ|nr:DUF4097 family beta strand repeat-containing protein [Pseudohongiella sp.]HDZ07946.1 hypothetical protein [Pseudohongiella sp.]HEA64447.1 hypothetical protein [Pseudohongiella sp.]